MIMKVLALSMLGLATAQTTLGGISVTPPAPAVGSPIQQLVITFTPDAKTVGNSDTITITMSGTPTTENVFDTAAGTAGVLTSGAEYTMTVGGGAYTGATVTITSATEITIEPITGTTDDILAGSQVILTLNAAALVDPQNANVNVEYTAATDGAGNGGAAVAASAWTTGAAGSLSDPITDFNGTRVKFWLPADKYTSLFETQEVHVLAKPLMGPGDLQWFESFKLVRPDGQLIADVAAVRGKAVNSNLHFGEQIDVTVAEEHNSAWHNEGFLFSTKEGKVKGAAYKIPYHIARTHGKNEIEHLHIETPSAAFNIYASHAGNEFPDDVEMQKKYVHLDWRLVSSLVPLSEYGGVLPELWGVVPTSDAVQAMTVTPTKDAAVCS